MMNKLKLAKARQNKLNKEKLAKEKADKALIDSILQFQDKTVEKLHDELSVVYDDFKELLARVDSKDYQQNLDAINNSLVSLIQKFEAGVNVNNIKEVENKTDLIVKNFRDMPKSFKVTNLKDIKLDTKGLATDKAIKELEGGLANIANQLGQLDELLQPAQLPENFVPFRRVVKVGNRLQFDDSSWSGASGGGGSSSTGLTDAELRATPVPVSMSSDIEIGAVELKNGTDDTRATVTAGNALKVDGSAVTQPISGTVTATPTGTQNVDVTANTIGLATSANQTNGNQIAVAKGDVASGSADSGNPVKVGAKYNATQPTFTDGQRADIQVDSRGNLRMGLYANNTQTTASFKADNADADATSATANKLGVMSRNTVYNGTTWDRQLGDATNGTLVNLGANNDVTVTSGAITETNSAAIKTAVETIDNAIAGNEMQVDVITMPTVTTTEAVPATIYNGKKTVATAGTRVTLAASQAVKSVTIKALSTNIGLIYVGDTSVASTNGFQLSAGETISMDLANLNTVNIDSSVSGEGVTYIGVN